MNRIARTWGKLVVLVAVFAALNYGLTDLDMANENAAIFVIGAAVVLGALALWHLFAGRNPDGD